MSVPVARIGGGEAEAPVPVEEVAKKRGLTGYILLLPGALWLILFFVVPAVTLVSTSLYDPSGSVLTGYEMTFHWQNYVDAIRDYATPFGRSFVYALIATVACILLGYPLAYAIAFKAGRWKNLMLVAVIAPFFTSFLIRTLSWQLLLGDNSFLVDAPQGPQHPRSRRAPAGHPVRGGDGPDLQLPAVHGAAALRQSGEDRPPADRSRERPVRHRVHGFPEDHLAAVDARPRRRHAAHLHPRRGRLHQRRAAGDAPDPDDRERDPGPVRRPVRTRLRLLCR